MYDPPSAHYSEIDVQDVDQKHVFAFMGKSGRRFYWLTRRLSLDYLWFDFDRMKIEIWGPFSIHESAGHILRAELDHFIQGLESRDENNTEP
jgi:hypothetical protein